MSGNRKKCNELNIDETKQHFEQLFLKYNLQEVENNILADDEHIQDLDEIEDQIFNSEITDEEIIQSVKRLKENKSAGPDEIPPGVFIHSYDIILPVLTKLFNRLYDTDKFLKSWSKAIIVPIHKKGDPNIVSNYRGISLLDILEKTTRLY